MLFVCGETCLGQLFPLRPGPSVIGVRIDAYAPSGREKPRNLNVFGIHQTDEILHDLVHAVLVKIPMIAEAEQVQFQALALHHSHVRDVADTYLSEVRLAGDRAQGGEFGTIEPHPVVIILVLVHEAFQQSGIVVETVIGFLAKGTQPFQFATFCHDLLSGFFEPLGVLRHLELVYALLDVSVHEDGQVIHGPVDAVVGHAGLRIVIGADLG